MGSDVDLTAIIGDFGPRDASNLGVLFIYVARHFFQYYICLSLSLPTYYLTQERETDRQIDRQTDRQTETGREKEREREREREREKRIPLSQSLNNIYPRSSNLRSLNILPSLKKRFVSISFLYR